jgi:UDP-N-acetylmuramyl pentapeptide phosphotransferase/UDP-N-acetylglucosamine-1-phosphate transferase
MTDERREAMEDIGAALGGIGILLVFLATFVLWIWALVDAVRAPEEQFRNGNRLIWVLVIGLTHFVGAVIYLAMGRPRRHQALA